MDDLYLVDVGPTDQPVSLEDAKGHLRVDTDDDDTLITGLIKAATLQAEKYTGRVFVERTIRGKFSGVDITQCERYPFLNFRRAPFQSVSSFQSEIDGALSDVDSDSYQIKETSSYPRILITDSLTVDDVPYPLVVIGVFGYGKAKDVPGDIKQAILELINFFYENRGDVDPYGKISMPREVKSKLGKYKIIDTF